MSSEALLGNSSSYKKDRKMEHEPPVNPEIEDLMHEIVAVIQDQRGMFPKLRMAE